MPRPLYPAQHGRTSSVRASAVAIAVGWSLPVPLRSAADTLPPDSRAPTFGNARLQASEGAGRSSRGASASRRGGIRRLRCRRRRRGSRCASPVLRHAAGRLPVSGPDRCVQCASAARRARSGFPASPPQSGRNALTENSPLTAFLRHTRLPAVIRAARCRQIKPPHAYSPDSRRIRISVSVSSPYIQ
jgi:hypothetical protein